MPQDQAGGEIAIRFETFVQSLTSDERQIFEAAMIEAVREGDVHGFRYVPGSVGASDALGGLFASVLEKLALTAQSSRG